MANRVHDYDGAKQIQLQCSIRFEKRWEESERQNASIEDSDFVAPLDFP